MPTSAVTWGCLAAVVSSAVQSFGITLQRKSHVLTNSQETPVSDNGRPEVDTLTNHQRQHHHRRHLWLTGFLMFIIANVLGSLVQLSTLPLIILSPLQSIGLIFNSLFSCLILPNEHFSKKLAWGTMVIFTGAFIIAYYGNVEQLPTDGDGSNGEFDLIMRKLKNPRFLAWWAFTFVTMLFIVRINVSLSRKIYLLSLKKRSRRSSRIKKHLLHRLTFIKGVLFGVISGTLTAHTFLFAKSIVDVLISALLGKAGSLSGSTYTTTIFLLLLTFSIIGMQLVAFNKGLSHILSSILYPLCFLVFNLVNLFNGIIFDELLASNLLTFKQLLMVVFGLLGVLYGVITISWDGARKGCEPTMKDDEEIALMDAKFPYHSTPLSGLLSFEKRELTSILSSEEQFLQ